MRGEIRIIRRGKVKSIGGAAARMSLLDWLRLEERATGTKEGCAEGDCGACTVVLARERGGRIVREPVSACILLAGQADGAEVVTVEDLAPGGAALHPVQDAMWRLHASQCGYCTPGIVMSLYALQSEAPRPVTRAAVCDQIAGNLCRCTGYRPIVDAALAACALPPDAGPGRATVEQLRALRDDEDILLVGDGGVFAAPASETSLADLLGRYSDAIVVAGATDVGLWFTKALVEPRRIIWLGRVQGLDGIEQHDGKLVIGATATVASAAAALGALAPDLGEVVRRFGSVQVRASATVGGNIANGSPIGDLAPCLIALGATLELGSAAGARTMPLEDYFIAYKKQDRRPGEYVRRVVVPVPPTGLELRAYKVSKRVDEDISAVLGAFAVRTDDRRIVSARLAFGGMAGTPARARATESLLAGIDLDAPESWRPALDALHDEFTPLDDHRASAAYRRLVARNLLEKALREIAGEAVIETRILAQGEVSHAAG